MFNILKYFRVDDDEEGMNLIWGIFHFYFDDNFLKKTFPSISFFLLPFF